MGKAKKTRSFNYLSSFLTVLVIALSLLVATLLHMQYILDLSLQPANKCSSQQPDHILITYADGPEIFYKNRNILAASAINRGFDSIINYSRKHIPQTYIEAHPILNEARGAGYWLWKPYLILETLNKLPDGVVVMYADTGLVIRQPLREYLAKGLVNQDKDVLLFPYNPHENGLAGHIAFGDTFLALNCTTENCRYGHHVWAGIIVTRNSPQSRQFMAQWLKACENPELLVGETKSANYSEFTHHQHDEAILSVLAARESAHVSFLPMDDTYRKHIHGHRRHAEGKSLLGFSSMQFSSPERRLPNWWWVRKITARWEHSDARNLDK